MADHKLSIKVCVFSQAVALQVIYQAEELRAPQNEPKEFVASNGFSISSTTISSATLEGFAINGYYRDNDNSLCTISFPNNQTRDRWVNSLSLALQEFKMNNFFSGRPVIEEPVDIIEQENVILHF